MSLELAIVLFEGEQTAAVKYAAAKERSRAVAGWTREAGLVEHHSSGHLALRGMFAGHYVDVDESDHVSQTGAGEGAVAGGLLGVLLGPPGIAVGLLVGGVIGSQLGKPTDVETEPGALARQLRAAVPRSSSAIALIAAPADVEEMLAALGEDAQRVVRQTLTPERVTALEASLGSAPPAPGGP